MKKLLTLILLIMACPAGMWAQEVKEHPRLLMGAGEEERIKEVVAADEALARVHEGILRECEGMLTLPVLERTVKGRRLLAVSREALKRIFWLSYSYRMTGKEAYADRAVEEIMAVCRFEDWNPSHFLDVGEMATAVSIGYDWLHGRLTEAQKEEIYDSIINKAFIPAENEEYAWFYNIANNWNQVCSCGLVYGALATYENNPEKSQELIDTYVKSVPFALAVYAPDGCYPEGFHYWGYGTSFQVMMISALESALGTDYGLSASEGFLETGDFVRFMNAPTGQGFNFSDAVPGAPCNPMMFWFAAKNNDPSLVWLERRKLENLPENFMDNASRLFTEYRLLPALMLFQTSKPALPQKNFKVYGDPTPLFVYREGWDSPDDAYLGIKGGTPMAYHAHMDAGSFIYEFQGVRWSVDLGLQDYHSLESKGVDLWNQGEDGQRWDVFRLGNDSHSTLTVNNRHHRAKSHVPITETWQSDERKGARLDMTSAFAGDVTSAEREIWLDRENHLHTRDIITAGAESLDVRWSMTTCADAEILPDGSIILRQEGKAMLLNMETEGMNLHVQPFILSNDPQNEYDAPNPGSCRVGFRVGVPAGVTGDLEVVLKRA